MIENREKLINLLDEMIYTTKIETIDGMTHLTKVRKKDEKIFGEYNQQTMEVIINNKVVRTDLFANSNYLIENINMGDQLIIVREKTNKFDSNALLIKNKDDEPIGYLDYSSAQVLSPLIDKNELEIINIKAKYVEPLSKRSKKSKYGLLYFELKLKVKNEYIQNMFALKNNSNKEIDSKYDRNKCIQKIKEIFMVSDINKVSYAFTTDDCYLLFVIDDKVENPEIEYWEENVLIGKNLLNEEFEKAIIEATGKHIPVFDYDAIELDEW